MLGQVALQAPGVVIAVLAAALRVDPRRLDVAVDRLADPHVLPGRRDDQGLDALKDNRVVGGAAVGIEVGEALALAYARQSRTLTGDARETNHDRRLPTGPDSQTSGSTCIADSSAV